MEAAQLIQAARRLYKTPGQHLTLGQVVELNKRFLQGYLHFKDEPKVQKLREDVLKYNRLLRDLGLRDHQVGAVLTALKGNTIHRCSHTGPEGTEGDVEDLRSAFISSYPVDCLGWACTPWGHS